LKSRDRLQVLLVAASHATLFFDVAKINISRKTPKSARGFGALSKLTEKKQWMSFVNNSSYAMGYYFLVVVKSVYCIKS